MKGAKAALYRSPVTKEELDLTIQEKIGDQVIVGTLSTPSAQTYPIVRGIPYLVENNSTLLESPDVKANREYYSQVSAAYDEGMDWLFRSFYEDETALRHKMVDLLDLHSSSRVLEIGAGTCRDSVELISRLNQAGEMFISDLSAEMLEVGQARLEDTLATASAQIEFLICDAAGLPFPDRYFDAAYHFGGLNLFKDQTKSFQEITRVVKVGGKVVIGDEGISPWLRHTTFGKILINSNSLYQHEPPLASIPIDAREVRLQWLLGNAFYLIDYRVGEGEPALDLDLPIPGKRGGTHRTRFYGVLEGIDPELKVKLIQSAAENGLSIHEWLEQTLRRSLS